MTEDSIQHNEEAVPSQTDEQNQSVLEDSDYKAMLLEETQQSKKYRKRAQKAEAKIQEYQKQKEKDKMSAMKENEQYKELSEDLQSKLDNVLPYKDKWETHEKTRRENLLKLLPEEDRESMSTKDTDTIEYVVSKTVTEKKSNPQHNANKSRNINSDNIVKDFTSLSGKEGRENYEAYLSELARNRNN
mgnify:CR=1 FL=1